MTCVLAVLVGAGVAFLYAKKPAQRPPSAERIEATPARLARGGSYAEWGLRAHVSGGRRADAANETEASHGGARYTLEGDVANSGYAYAVNLRLVVADTKTHLWSERDMLQPSDLASESAARLRNLARRVRTALITA